MNLGAIVAGLFALIIIIAALAIGGFILWQGHSAQRVAVQAQRQAGAATVSAGQAQAETATQRIVVAGQARDQLDIEVHQHNDRAIAAAPGADAPLDPRLNDVGRRGLCQHPAYAADPGCAGLRPADPAELPDPGGGNAAAAP